MKLEKSMGVKDVMLMSVVAIVGLRWISLAAATGNVSIFLWICALVFFFLPSALAVIELTTRLPGEGGIYVWVKEAFGNKHAFLAGWCYWTNNLVYFPNLLVYIAGISVYVLGAEYIGLGNDKTYIVVFSLIALWFVTIFNIIGLKTGKWINNIGGIGTWVAGAALIFFGFVALYKYGIANPMPVESFFKDSFTFAKLNFWASICFGFTGLELASVLAGEVRDPRRSIPKATIYAGITVAAIYILGTFALLVSIPANDINIISGILQGIAAVAEKTGFAWTSSVIALLITLGGIGGLMAWFSGAARMPFVAGIDNYLPKSFGKLHPKYNTPYIAVLIQAAIATFFIIMSFWGSKVEEAYLILLDTTLLVYFIPYAYMFAAYINLRYKKLNDSDAQKIPSNDTFAYICGGIGLFTTLTAMLFSVLPSADMENVLLYETKVIGGFLAFILTGILIFWWKNRTQSTQTK